MNYTPEQKEAWDKAIKLLEDNLIPISFSTWIKPLELHSVTQDSIRIMVDNSFTLNHVKQRYYTDLYNMLKLSFGRSYELEFYTRDELARLQSEVKQTTLNPKYSFENFVVGPSNSFACAASLAVAEEPSAAYNPLFIYGSVGLGKTHLMNAIGNYTLARDPRKNVLFISSETFTNEFIDALAKKKGTSDLRDRMRSVDVLMVDDIQFLSKTVATQEEFFHTFNDLHAKGKQIILSSDRPPREIPTIEDRLRSRFEWGLIVDIRRPDFETRMAILQRKCEDDGVDCDPEVLEFIAGRVKSNIRELEGALNRLIAKHQLIGGRIDLAFAQETLDAILPVNAARVVNAQTILAAVAERYAVTSEDLLSKKRTRDLTLPRQIAMYMIRDMTSLSTTAIGSELGGRDHTTVMHGCDQIARMLQADPTLRKNLDDLKESLLKG